MKRILSLFTAIMVILATALLTSCGDMTANGKSSIVCTAFAQYDFTMNILGERSESFDVKYLLSSGTDMHSYSNSVSVADKADILSSEIFICIGGESEAWIDELLDDRNAKGVRVLKLIDEIGEAVCAGGESHDHTHAHDCDEHIWLSPKRAKMMCSAICEQICAVDPDNAEIYRSNSGKYIEKLEKLDREYESVFEGSGNKPLVFADRFPFVYLTSDYSVTYSAAFDGCSSEADASFETVARLVKDINENNVSTLIALEKSTTDISYAVIRETGRSDIVTARAISMQNVSEKDIDGGLTYLSAMYENLEVFRKAMD